ncbi:MAG: hypothetical protein ACLFQV_02135 [Vulcanimicrobiota bacterium]
MKNLRSILLLCLAALVGCIWVIGCTGGGLYDHHGPNVSPTVTPTSPTTVPTLSFPQGKTLTQLVTGRQYTYDIKLWGNSPNQPYVNFVDVGGTDYYWGENYFWTEALSNPNGKVAFDTLDRTKNKAITELASGLQQPKGMVLYRTYTDQNDPTKNEDWLFVSSDGDPSGGVINRYKIINGAVTETVELTNGIQGDINYVQLQTDMNGDLHIFATVDAGINSRIISVPADKSAGSYPMDIAELDSNLNQANGLLIFHHAPLDNITSSFLFVTERAATPDGQIKVYNISNWAAEGYPSVEPVVMATNQQKPSKMAFFPDIQLYNVQDQNGNTIDYYSHSATPQGYLVWTNFHSTNGQVVRVKVGPNNEGTNLKPTATPEIIAQSLKAPYDIIGFDNFRYLYLKEENGAITTEPYTGNKYNTFNSYLNEADNPFNMLYVSSNLTAVDGGTWYKIDVSDFSSGTPLTPASTGVESYLSTPTAFPLNGEVQVFMKGDGSTIDGEIFKVDLFFTSFNIETDGSEDGGIYLQQENF